MSDHQVVETSPDQPAFRRIFVQTFSKEPSFEFMLRDARTRNRGVAWLCDMKLRSRKASYFTLATTTAVRGFAWWLPPTRAPARGLFEQLRAGYWQAPFRLGLGGFERMLQFGTQEARLLEKYLVTPHWILDVIATDPTAQRSGIGGALMQPVFERSARDGIPCFVLTHNPRNVGFYEKYGFRLVIEEPLGKAGTPVAYGLERAARP